MANTQRTRAALLDIFRKDGKEKDSQNIRDLIVSLGLVNEVGAINVTGSVTGYTLTGSLALADLGTATELLASGGVTTTVATKRVTAGNAGTYLVLCSATAAVNNANSFTLQLYKTTVATPAAIVGAKTTITLPVANETENLSMMSIVTLAAGDFVQLFASGTVGDTLTVSEMTLTVVRVL